MQEHWQAIVESRRIILDIEERRLARFQGRQQKSAIAEDEVDLQIIEREQAAIALQLALLHLDEVPDDDAL